MLCTWLCGAALSLLNFDLLAGLAIPPLLFDEFYSRFSHLAAIPLLIAGAGSGALTWLLFRRDFSNASVKSVAINAFFYVTFLIVADHLGRCEMREQAAALGAECTAGQSLLASISRHGEEVQDNPHAVAIANGQVLIWSYREMRFFPVDQSLWQNLNLGDCEPYVAGRPRVS